MIGTIEIIFIAGVLIAFFGVGVVKKWAKGAKEVKEILKDDETKTKSV